MASTGTALARTRMSSDEQINQPIRIIGRLPYNPTIPAARLRKAVFQVVRERQNKERKNVLNGNAE